MRLPCKRGLSNMLLKRPIQTYHLVRECKYFCIFNRGHIAEALEDQQLGAHIHIYVFTDCKNNDFKVLSSKKINTTEHI